jgi:DNA polymerase (family 10)
MLCGFTVQDPRDVARALEETAALLRFTGEGRFTVEAYERAAQVVAAVDAELAGRIEQDSLEELPGIGAALSRQIKELWNTGNSALLERLRREQPAGAAELMRVPGLTPRRIRALSQALDISSIDGLIAACVAGQVRTVPGFGAKTEQKLLEACRQFLDRKPEAPPRLLLSEARAILTTLSEGLRTAASRVEIAGSVRRGEELNDELALIAVGEPETVIARLRELRGVLRVDPISRRAVLSAGVPLAVHPCDPARAGGVWAEATGNAAHWAELCRRAERRGIDLRERSFSSEEELYATLGLVWIPPELRRGETEFEAAEGSGFADLVELADIRGFIHCHTTYSDGRASVLEMASAAHARGMQYITITDHSPSAHYASGVSLDRLKQQWDEIAEAQERVPIRIFRGTESDILSDGSLDYPDAVLEQFDVIIASIHARYRQDRATMTARLRRALSLPLFKIWGHALGRILNHRPAIDCDVPALLDALADSRGAIELNADPHRLDLPAEWILEARRRGIPFVISVDAHSPQGLGVLPDGVVQARRGGLNRAEVLNTSSAEAFCAAVRPTTRA